MTSKESELLARALEFYRADIADNWNSDAIDALDALLARLPEIVRREKIGEVVEGFVAGAALIKVGGMCGDGIYRDGFLAHNPANGDVMDDTAHGTPMDALESAGLVKEE